MYQAKICLFLVIYFSFTTTTATSQQVSRDDQDLVKNRLNIAIISDASLLNDYFSGDEQAAFQHLVGYFDTVNQVILQKPFTFKDFDGQEHQFLNYGFSLRKISLHQGEFASQEGLNRLEKYDEAPLKDFLKVHLRKMGASYALVLFLTAKDITNLNGFSLGRVCAAGLNLAAVSFSRCRHFRSDLTKTCLTTLLHELLHSIGAEHTASEDDVMRAEDPKDWFLNDDTVKSIAVTLSVVEEGCLQSVSQDSLLLVDSKETSKVVDYQKMLDEFHQTFTANNSIIPVTKSQTTSVPAEKGRGTTASTTKSPQLEESKEKDLPNNTAVKYIIGVSFALILVLVVYQMLKYFFKKWTKKDKKLDKFESTPGSSTQEQIRLYVPDPSISTDGSQIRVRFNQKPKTKSTK